MSQKDKKPHYIYLAVIVLVWFLLYISAQIFFEQKLGWDEVAYMSIAKGIASDFDFSARAYTIMGILKHGFPTHFINYPLSSIYIGIFYKLFGYSIKVAYFSTWLAGLGVCILIYFISLMVLNNSKKMALGTSLFYLLYPGMYRNLDSGMMEQLGNLFLCASVYLIMKDYSKGKFNWFTVLKFSISMVILWLYKTLFVGVFLGYFFIILLAYFFKEKINSKINFYVFTASSYGLFMILFVLVSKFIFLPVAPMMNFTPDKEARQVYSDFLGGYFIDFPQSLIVAVKSFFLYILKPYFLYPTVYTDPSSQFFAFIPHVVVSGFYFLIVFILIGALLDFWKLFSGIQKVFVVFTLTAIVSFNLIFNCIFNTTFENVWRYNIYYVPLFLITLAIYYQVVDERLKDFNADFKRSILVKKTIIFIFIFIPMFFSMINIQQTLFDRYHNRAKDLTGLVNKFLQDDKPEFIYLNDGTHLTLLNYPMKQVFKDATNEQLVEVNKILPQPIKYLFLRPSDWLFQNNKEKVLMAEPIINDSYGYWGHNNDAQIIVYKYREKAI